MKETGGSCQISVFAAFCQVIESGSFIRAAEQLGITQPAVSQQIKHLEEVYGTKLLHREGARVVPTEEGKVLYEYAARLVTLFERSKQAFRETRKRLTGKLSLGASTGVGEYLLPIALARFKRDHPKAKLSMYVGDSDDIIMKVLQQRIDLGFVGVSRRDRHLRFEPFLHDRLVLVVSPKNGLAQHRSVSLEEFMNIPLILQQPGSGATSALRLALRSQGLRLGALNVVMEAGLQESTKAAVRLGLGATVISRLGVLEELRTGKVVEVDIEGLNLEHDFYIVYHRDWPLSRLASTFIEVARATASKVETFYKETLFDEKGLAQ